MQGVTQLFVVDPQLLQGVPSQKLTSSRTMDPRMILVQSGSDSGSSDSEGHRHLHSTRKVLIPKPLKAQKKVPRVWGFLGNAVKRYQKVHVSDKGLRIRVESFGGSFPKLCVWSLCQACATLTQSRWRMSLTISARRQHYLAF